MFKPVNRLTKKNDFDRIFKNGQSSYNDLIGFKVLKNNLEQNRFGIVVGLKVSKKAVERNRIKRRIGAVLKREQPFLKSGRDYLFIALPPILGKKYQDTENSLLSHLTRLRLYKSRTTIKQKC